MATYSWGSPTAYLSSVARDTRPILTMGEVVASHALLQMLAYGCWYRLARRREAVPHPRKRATVSCDAAESLCSAAEATPDEATPRRAT